MSKRCEYCLGDYWTLSVEVGRNSTELLLAPINQPLCVVSEPGTGGLGGRASAWFLALFELEPWSG